jgi:hypothetical protein
MWPPSCCSLLDQRLSGHACCEQLAHMFVFSQLVLVAILYSSVLCCEVCNPICVLTGTRPSIGARCSKTLAIHCIRASDPHSSGLHIQGATPAAVGQATYLLLLLFGFKTRTVPDTGQPFQFGLALVLQISAGGTASLLLTAIVSSARKRRD